jgi:hypothetical protein
VADLTFKLYALSIWGIDGVYGSPVTTPEFLAGLNDKASSLLWCAFIFEVHRGAGSFFT